MNIIEIDLNDRKQVQQFLQLPFRLYRDTPQWVPPLEMDARRMLEPKRHPFYQHGRAAFFVAKRGEQAIGRLAVLINHSYVEYNQEKSAFFYLFECEDDPEAAGGLFTAGMDWAKAEGMQAMIGPKGFSVFDGMGLLVRGFEHRPAYGLPYNLPYYPRLVETQGFVCWRELVSGYLDETMAFPERVHRAAELLMRRRGLRIARFETRKDLLALVPHLRQMYNDALAGTEGNYPISDVDAKGMADQMYWFADPKLIKIVMKGDQPVGFLFAYPDVSAAVQRTRGRLLPFGWLDLLRELRATKWININGAGMIDGYRGLGGTAILFSEMYKTVVESRYRYADVVQIGLENENMLREMRDLGIEFYKAHHLYRQEL